MGRHCESCKPNFYNYPICEECNCHPSGVVPEFGGCDKVAPGELCTCRENVDGRTCSQCKPTFWDLKAHHKEGCIGKFNFLIIKNCKSIEYLEKKIWFISYKQNNFSIFIGCNCNITGTVSLLDLCDQQSGQCLCKRFVGGQKCDQCAGKFESFFDLKIEIL